MKTTRLLVVIPVVFCGLSILQGCATQPTHSGSGISTTQSPGVVAPSTDSNLSTEEKRIRDQGSWFTVSNAQGCVAGGVVGGVIGAVLGGQNNRGTGAAVGAGTGCLMGIGVNTIFQSMRKTLASEEEIKQELIAQAKEENEKTRLYITDANRVIAADLNKIAAIQKDLTRKKISLNQAKQEIQQVDANIAVMNKTLTGMKSHETQLREAAIKSPSLELDREIAQYQGQISAYDSELSRLVERRNMTKV